MARRRRRIQPLPQGPASTFPNIGPAPAPRPPVLPAPSVGMPRPAGPLGPPPAPVAPPTLPGIGPAIKLPAKVAAKPIRPFPSLGRPVRDPNALPLAKGPAPLAPAPGPVPEPYPMVGAPDLSPLPLATTPAEQAMGRITAPGRPALPGPAPAAALPAPGPQRPAIPMPGPGEGYLEGSRLGDVMARTPSAAPTTPAEGAFAGRTAGSGIGQTRLAPNPDLAADRLGKFVGSDPVPRTPLAAPWENPYITTRNYQTAGRNSRSQGPLGRPAPPPTVRGVPVTTGQATPGGSAPTFPPPAAVAPDPLDAMMKPRPYHLPRTQVPMVGPPDSAANHFADLEARTDRAWSRPGTRLPPMERPNPLEPLPIRQGGIPGGPADAFTPPGAPYPAAAAAPAAAPAPGGPFANRRPGSGLLRPAASPAPAPPTGPPPQAAGAPPMGGGTPPPGPTAPSSSPTPPPYGSPPVATPPPASSGTGVPYGSPGPSPRTGPATPFATPGSTSTPRTPYGSPTVATPPPGPTAPPPPPPPGPGGATFGGRMAGGGIPPGGPGAPLPGGMKPGGKVVKPLVRPSVKPPSRVAATAAGLGGAAALQFGADPEGTARMAGHPLSALYDMGMGVADSFRGLADGRARAGLNRLISGEPGVFDQAVRATPILGQLAQAGENIGHGAASIYMHPEAANDNFQRGVDVMGQAFMGPYTPPNQYPAPRMPTFGPTDPVPTSAATPAAPATPSAPATPATPTTPLSALDPAQLVSGAMNPPTPTAPAAPAAPALSDLYARDEAFRATLPHRPGEQPSLPPGYENAFRAAAGFGEGGPKWNPAHPYYTNPQVTRDRETTRAAMRQYGFAAPAYTNEVAAPPTPTPPPNATPTPAAPGTPATPAAPAGDPIRDALAWQAQHPTATRAGGAVVYSPFAGAGGPSRAEETMGNRSAFTNDLSRYDLAQAEAKKGEAEGRLAGAKATGQERANRPLDETLGPILQDDAKYAAYLIDKQFPPEQIPAMVEWNRQRRSQQAGSGPGFAPAASGQPAPGPAGSGPRLAMPAEGVNQQNFLDTLRGDRYFESLRPHFDPTYGSYNDKTTLPEVLDAVMTHPGATDPNHPVNQIIRQGIANRFPGEQLPAQLDAIGPYNDPYHSGFTSLLGNNMLGRLGNRAFGWARDVNPFLGDAMGTTNWFQNFNRRQKYSNHLRGLGFVEVDRPQ